MSDLSYDPQSFNATMARLEAKLDQLISRHNAQDSIISRLAERIEKLERFKYFMMAAAFGAGGLGGKLIELWK
jgi:outer membrane murein-binding lipoprotein Lpp